MKTLLSTRLALAGAVALFTYTALAQPATKATASSPKKPITITTDVTSDRGVLAQYVSVDPTGCIETDVLVQADVVREENSATGTTVNPAVSLLISVYDSCQFYGLFFASGSTDTFTMTLDGHLKRARLRAKVGVMNQVTNGFGYVDVDLTWEASAPLETTHSNTRTPGDGTLTIEEFFGRSQQAKVTGTVSIGGYNYAADPAAWSDHELHDLLDTTVTIQHP